ncbi:ABC transporter C family member 10-like [Gossypium australe]|uniref:ABC transporter C family member 10-like n=1 Tax=Gossypium australe TaxID=47621 RepID=A0A5B6WRG7_9ROSI|nr:ABC transporter C family member 10-like [Gossypium australe]
MHQLDVKSAFLNGILKEEGFVTNGDEHKVCKLKKALYCLKRAPQTWYDRVDKHLSSLGFERSINEPILIRNLHKLEELCFEDLKQVLYGKLRVIKHSYCTRVDEGIYRGLIGCFLYLKASRLDIMFVGSLLSRYMHCCNVVHVKATKRVPRYVKGTLSYRVKFMKTVTELVLLKICIALQGTSSICDQACSVGALGNKRLMHNQLLKLSKVKHFD